MSHARDTILLALHPCSAHVSLKGRSLPKESVVHVRIDPGEKQEAEELYARMGATLSEAMRMFVHESIRTNGFPFRPTGGPEEGAMKAKGILHVYAGHKLDEAECRAWIESPSDEY